MRRSSAVVFALLALSGCVSKSKYTALEAQLAECRKDKEAAQESAKTCEARFNQESELWKSVGSSVESALPKALKNFEDEKQKIIEMVPQQVKQEVTAYLEDFARAVSKSFVLLREDNKRMMAELQGHKGAIEDVGRKAASIEGSVTARLDAVESNRQKSSARVADVITAIQDWDRRYVNEKSSDERLGLNRKEREAIVNFHAQLVADLNSIATGTGIPPAGDAEAGAAEAAGEEAAPAAPEAMPVDAPAAAESSTETGA